MSEPVTGDTVIRTADGSIFLLRREVMEACRVTEPEYVEQMERILAEHEVAGFSLSTGGIVQTATFDQPPVPQSPNVNPMSLRTVVGSSTVMCCW